MKNLIILALVLSVFMACGGASEPSRDNVIVINGAIANENISFKLEWDPKRSASVASEVSVMTDIVSPERMPAIKAGEPIVINTTVHNLGVADMKGLDYEIEIENAQFLTPERWTCFIMYDALAGDMRQGVSVWEVFTEPLPECAGPPSDPNYVCDADVLDCANPSYEVTYTPPGDGLWRMSGHIESIEAGASFNQFMSFADTGMDARPGHYARWSVYSGGVLLDRRDYSFDVSP